MSKPVPRMPMSNSPPRRRMTLAAAASILLVVLLAGMVAGYFCWYPSRIGPAQPISFSHRVHVTDKHLSCVFCHNGVLDTPHAGVPPVQTCMLCHERIIITHPEIVKLRGYWDRKEPVPWARVNDVPDYVFFNHQVHIRKGFDCGKCHGDVAGMDRVAMPWDLNMGLCVQCHRDENYSHDCYVCHR